RAGDRPGSRRATRGRPVGGAGRRRRARAASRSEVVPRRARIVVLFRDRPRIHPGMRAPGGCDAMAGPSDLERFLGYVRAFEQAYWSDDWSLLAPHWRPDGVHRVHGAAPLGADDRGAEAAIAGLRASVHGMDRRFDVRIPEIVPGPCTREGGVWMRFTLTLRRAGLPDLRFEGEHWTRYQDGRIARIE